MTSRRWLVERDELDVDDILMFPVPTPSATDIINACDIYDKIVSENMKEDTEKLVDKFVYDLYKLKNYEIEFVENAVAYVYDYFYAKGKSKSLARPQKTTLDTYKSVLTNILKKSLGTSDAITCNFYCGDAPLVIAQIMFGTQAALNTDIEKAINIDELLYQLDELLLSERSGSVAVKRNVRVYNKELIYIIKPNQSRYWSYSFACRDADEIYADIMRTWSENNE